MHKFILPIIIAASLPFGGCAFVPFAPVLVEAVNSANQAPYAAADFGTAAAEACRARATRHGRATVTRVEPLRSNLMRVTGTVETGQGFRNFTCSFSSGGRVTDFKLS